jgi:hypothetical protein
MHGWEEDLLRCAVPVHGKEEDLPLVRRSHSREGGGSTTGASFPFTGRRRIYYWCVVPVNGKEEDLLLVREDLPVVREDLPVVREDLPVVREELPVVREELLLVREELLLVREELETVSKTGRRRKTARFGRPRPRDVRPTSGRAEFLRPPAWLLVMRATGVAVNDLVDPH